MFITCLFSDYATGRAAHLLQDSALPVLASDYNCIITRQIVNL